MSCKQLFFAQLQVKRVLPQWLAQPDVIQRDMKNNLIPISQVPGICPILLKKLEANGIQSFFPGKYISSDKNNLFNFVLHLWICHHISSTVVTSFSVHIWSRTYELDVASAVLCLCFSVQSEVIPAILESVSSGLLLGPGGYRPRDICVSAPTGSGKTLAFVIPVIQVQTMNCIRMHFYFSLQNIGIGT